VVRSISGEVGEMKDLALCCGDDEQDLGERREIYCTSSG